MEKTKLKPKAGYQNVLIWLSDHEHKVLLKQAKKAGLSFNDYVVKILQDAVAHEKERESSSENVNVPFSIEMIIELKKHADKLDISIQDVVKFVLQEWIDSKN
jgi:KaiC/GvpD/RAD55 family RecA-like ATPase